MQPLEERPYEELAWLAFCYATDEMSAGEVQAFEARLATDQAAREALAEAVLLSQAVLLAPRETAPDPRDTRLAPLSPRPNRRQFQPLGWVAAVVAACIMVVLIADSWLAAPREQVRPVANLTNDSLALAWVTSEVSLDSVAAEADLLAGLDESESGDADVGHMTVPNWMLEAVSTRGAEVPDPSKES